jgi:hypothetical protein
MERAARTPGHGPTWTMYIWPPRCFGSLQSMRRSQDAGARGVSDPSVERARDAVDASTTETIVWPGRLASNPIGPPRCQ